MATLAEQLVTPKVRPQLVHDCIQVLDDEVASKRGLSGLAVKGAYKAVKAIRPGFISGVVDALLDEWVAELETVYTGFVGAAHSRSFGAHLLTERDEVAERLLHVTDRRAQTTKHTTAKKFYNKLRPSAKQQVAAALPRLTRVLDRYVGD